MKNSLGIIGGVGPLASSYFYELLTKKTKASKDQEHLNIILFSHASIPDRTNYILDNNNESPFPYLLDDAKKLESLGAQMIVIPCNTSCYFHEKLQNEISIPVNNMILDTAIYIKKKGLKKVAILATAGTIYSNLYQDALNKLGIEYEIANNDKIMRIIYDYVKAGKEVTLDLFKNAISNLKVDGYILGCTELSILKEKLNLPSNFIDPLEIEVIKVLDFFGKERID